MKRVFTIILTLFSTYCFSQVDNYKFPEIALTGKYTIDFLPSRWTIRDTLIGDFNKDSLNDIAIVIETKQPLVFEDTTCFSSQPYHPKMLLVLSKQSNKTLQLSAKATKLFGHCNWGVQGFDPFDKITERRNTLGITFLTGGTLRDEISYYFRFQDNDWYLIGAESFQYWAGHTDGKDSFYHEKVNLLSGIRETYNEDRKGNRINYKKATFEKKSLIKMTDVNDNSSIPFEN